MKIKATLTKPQIRGANFLLNRKAGILNYATGTGKTLISILVGFKLIHDRKVDKVIYISTKSSAIEIKGDFEKFTDESPYSIKGEESLIDFLKESSNPFGIIQYNVIYALVPTFQVEEDQRKKPRKEVDGERVFYIKKIFGTARIAAVFDEVHTLKNPTSAVRKGWYSLRNCFNRAYGLTATPMTRDIYDLFHVIRFFDPAILGGYAEFTRLFVKRIKKKVRQGRKTATIWQIVSYKNLDTLAEWVGKIKYDYFPEYDIRFIEHKTYLAASSEEPYLTAAEGFLNSPSIQEIADAKESGEDIAASQAQHSVRLLDLQAVVNDDPNKQELFRERVVERAKVGTLVFCSYYTSIDIVSEILDGVGIEYRQINGKQDSAKRSASKDWFVADPTNKALLITLAGGQSLNLQASPNLIFWDLPYGMGHFIQILGRTVREFSEHKTFHIDFIIARDTVDEYKFAFLKSKKELVEKLTSNKVIPPGELNGYNAYVLSRLRERLLWKSRQENE